jgi:hypothetical protein
MADVRPVPDFPGYTITSNGVITNVDRNTMIRPRANKQHIEMVGLSRDGRQYTRSVSSLAAKAFLDPPPNEAYDSIIHLNGDRSDCRSINLMWRPRWYTVKYHKMFAEEPTRVAVRVPALGRNFRSLRQFCTTYGLVESFTYVDMLNNDPCFHYGWKLERWDY